MYYFVTFLMVFILSGNLVATKIDGEKPVRMVVKNQSVDQIAQQQFINLAGTYDYKVYVENSLSGWQKMVVSPRSDGSVFMKSSIKFSFRALLFFTVTYEHQCEEVWKNGQLQSMNTYTVKNGTKIVLKLKRQGRKMVGTLDGRALSTVAPVSTNNAWNLGVSFKHRKQYNVINPEDGTISQLSFSTSRGAPFKFKGRSIYNTLLKSQGRSWEFWFSPRNVMLKQKDVLKGYTVEIVLNNMTKGN